MVVQPGQSAVSARKLSVRVGLLCLPPLVAAFIGLQGSQVAFCACSAVAWSLLEAGLAQRTRLCSGCRRVPFVFRLVGAFGLDVQASWLLSTDGVPERYNVPGEVRASPGVVTTLSVVLPCANETDFVLKTVRSIAEFTPVHELMEIIVVDDASNPRISTLIASEQLEAYRARIIRHDIAQGLIRSKKHGADVAQGDAIVFLDCHVRPVEGWTKGIIRNLRENAKRVVVPFITSLDLESWQEISPNGGGRKMCLTWNADFFWCNEYPGRDVPIASGGLLATTRFWWETIGGYDEDMHAWGGENLDHSLRTWLCGGEIVVADESRVAHMWREASNPKTQLHYSIPTNDVRRNRLRAVDAWLGEFAAKVRTFPEFEDFAPGGPLQVGNLDNIVHYREKLKCKGFEWYMNRFQDYYLHTGMLPKQVFNLRDRRSKLCLSSELSSGKKISLLPCSRSSETQRFHESNAHPRGGCCSGMKLWDFDACLAAFNQGEEPKADPCNLFGQISSQHVELSADGLLTWNKGAGCLSPKNRDGKLPVALTRSASDPLVLAPCAAPEQVAKAGQGFSKHELRSDGTFQLRLDNETCLGHGVWNGLTVLMTNPCGHGSDLWSHEAGQIRNLALGLCVDANDMVTPILYPCYPPGQNSKQHYLHRDNGWLELPRSWADNGRQRFPAKCLDSLPVEPVELTVANCNDVQKAGDRWDKLWEEVPLETQIFQKIKAKGKFLWKP